MGNAVRAAALVLLMSCFCSIGASRYFDPELTSGANNGTDWSNAWTNTLGTLSGGDTLFLSGGSTQKVYTNIMTVPDGTLNNYIRVRIGQDAGHSGRVVFSNARLTHSGSASWIWFDGSRSDAFISPTNHQQVIAGPSCITNNIGIWIDGLVGTIDSDTSPVLWSLPTGVGNLKFSYIGVTGMTNTLIHSRGTVFNASRGGRYTNMIFEYLYLNNNSGQQFASTSDAATEHDEKVVKYCWITGNGEDHFEVGGGWTIRDSVIGPCSGTSAHTDLFQFTGNYFKVYNCDIRESMNAVLRYQTQGGVLSHSLMFFNNIVAERSARARFGGTRNEYIQFVPFDSQASAGGFLNGYSNVIVANNLFYNSISNTFGTNYGLGESEMCRTAFFAMSRGNYDTNKVIWDSKFVNNLVIDKEKGTSFAATTNANPALGYWNYTTNDFWVDYNVFAGTNSVLTTPRQVNYHDEDIMDGVSDYSFSNTTNYPTFSPQREAYWKFELSAKDTVALNTGYDLSAYFNFDSLNRPRGVNGAWDRGPLELQTTNLIAWLTFDESDWTAAHKIVDFSGWGNHGWRRGHTNDYLTSITNWPSRFAATNTPGSNQVGWAGHFTWTNSTYGTYTNEGAYLALTNTSQLTNWSQASVMCWARHYQVTTNNCDNPAFNYLCGHTAQFISAGGGAAAKPSSWNFGRNSSAQTRLSVLTNGTGSSTRDKNFPDEKDPTEETWLGNTTNWNHYAWSWSNGVIQMYFNGTNCGSADYSAVTNRLNPGMNGGGTPWIAIGVNHHGGDQWLQIQGGDDYPNNGWLHGIIDDVRIYTGVTLTATNILDIYREPQYRSAYEEFLIGAESEPATVTTAVSRQTKLRGIKLR
jgi:hypothetical protein